jgi:hypothetical protein
MNAEKEGATLNLPASVPNLNITFALLFTTLYKPLAPYVSSAFESADTFCTYWRLPPTQLKSQLSAFFQHLLTSLHTLL